MICGVSFTFYLVCLAKANFQIHFIKTRIQMWKNEIFISLTHTYPSDAITEPSRAWEYSVSSRRTALARGIRRFLSGGALPRVEICISWVMDCSCAWKSAFLERWSSPAREIMQFLSNRVLQPSDTHIFLNIRSFQLLSYIKIKDE